MSQRVYSRLGKRRMAEAASAAGPQRQGNGAGYLDIARPDERRARPTFDEEAAVAVDAFDTASPRPSTAAAETFRTLALTVDLLLAESSMRSLVVLSAMPGDGRTLTADLLARGLSEIRPPVRLLDGDPFEGPRRRPLPWTSAPHAIDLTDGSASGADFARLPVASGVFANHREFLAVVRARLMMETAAGATVVIDVPACHTSSVAFAVAEMADAAIYVARTDTEASNIHAEMRAQLDLLGVRLLGVVFNEK